MEGGLAANCTSLAGLQQHSGGAALTADSIAVWTLELYFFESFAAIAAKETSASFFRFEHQEIESVHLLIPKKMTDFGRRLPAGAILIG